MRRMTIGSVLLAGLALAGCDAMNQPMLQNNQAMKENPQAWCIYSPEPSRCRARAAAEHQICMGANNYGACRHAVDQMHGP